jgi:ABC-2 type transport system ATP-binding protein
MRTRGQFEADISQNEVVTSTGGALSAVSKQYSHRGPRVLDNVDLVLTPGSRTAVVGGNGSGKSTLLRIVAGVSRPTSGAVDLPPRIGYIPERLPDRINFTGYEYAVHMGRIRGLDGREADRRTREMFDRMGLRPGADVAFGSLSKGNRQKVMLVQAFLEPVDLLVLDEPVSGLDSHAVQAFSELVDEAWSEGTAVLVSGHEANRYIGIDQVVGIENGSLIETSKPPTALPALRDRLIVLSATPAAHPAEAISMLPGVSRTQVDATGLSLSLVADRMHADAVLSQAIQWGWSVNLVNDVRDTDGRP